MSHQPRRSGYSAGRGAHHHHHHHGWGGGQGGKGQGGGRSCHDPRPTTLQIETNYFKLTMEEKQEEKSTTGKQESSSSSSSSLWTMYSIQMSRYIDRIEKDDTTGDIIRGDDGKPKRKRIIKKLESMKLSERIQEDGSGSDSLSRKIQVQFTKDMLEKHGKIFLADGHAIGYSSSPLFEDKDKAAEGGQPFKEYEVRIKKGCEADDPHKDRVKDEKYLVQIIQTGKIDPDLQQQQGIEVRQKIIQAIQIFVNTALNFTMRKSGRDNKSYYLKEPKQAKKRSLLGSYLSRDDFIGSKTTFAPCVGIQPRVRFCEKDIYLSIDTNVGWFHRAYSAETGDPIPLLQNDGGALAGATIEHFHAPITDMDTRKNIEEAIPLLQNDGGTLAGVTIENFHAPITDMDTRKNIEEAFKRRTFHVAYQIPVSDSNEYQMNLKRKWQQQGLSEDKILEALKKKTCIYRPSLKMRTPFGKDAGKPMILWGGTNNKDEHSFEVNGEKHTIASYFKYKYQKDILFPHLPAIFTTAGYYPVEFMFQSDEKVVDANDKDKIDAVLNFNDEFAAGERITHIRKVLNMALNEEYLPGFSLRQVLLQFGIQISLKPESFEAVVLPEPTLKFVDTIPANITNGSWNLRNKKFARPATLFTYAVIDLTDGKAGEGSVDSLIRDLFDGMKRHGMTVAPDNYRDLLISRQQGGTPEPAEVSAECFFRRQGGKPEPAELYDIFASAVQKSKDHYLGKKYFKTNVLCDDGVTRESIVMKDEADEAGRYCMIYPNKNTPTHVIQNHKNGANATARIKFHVKDQWRDPWDHDLEKLLSDLGKPLSKYERGYELSLPFASGTKLIIVPHSKAILAKSPPHALVKVNPSDIEVPSMVFVYLPDKNTETYNFVKFLSHFQFGVNSQCVVRSEYSTQKKGPAQFCSNIALKLNTKLLSFTNKARAWTTFFEDLGEVKEGIPWVSEVPTLVVGIAMSNEIGQVGCTVVCASVCLDGGCMQMAQVLRTQPKGDTIEGTTMVYVIKCLAIQYYQHTGEKPQRVLIYRDGASDGSFDAIICNEVAAVRRALYEINRDTTGFLCPNALKCNGNGCIECCQPITYIALQSDHNVRIVPKPSDTARRQNEKKKNVPSGTCVDSVITSFQNGLHISTPEEVPQNNALLFADEGHSSDFFLTAQGGLKGTSKPMYYRVLLNENIRWAPQECAKATALTKEKLQKLTYHMAFQYGTATKAPRKIPVVLYSERLAKIAISYAGYLSGRKTLPGHSGEEDLIKKFNTTPNFDTMDPNQVYRNDMEMHELAEAKSELLKDFGPFGKGFPLERRVAFHTHIAA